MTTASEGVAVVATEIARTDRRALSEAWYSALHLAHDAAPGRPAAPRAAAARAAQLPRPRAAAPAPDHGRTIVAAPPHARRAADAPVTAPGERRRELNAAARRIVRAAVRLSARRPVPAAHTVDVAGGRVRLLVHGDGRTTRIVALCSRPLREQVERALASARYALAGGTIAP